jgi:hypothetical protein
MNFSRLTGLAICASLLMSLASCSSNSDSKDIDAMKIKTNSNLSPSQKAEQLAKAAEQLMTYQGFAYANDVADMALQQDSANVRAQFVKAILGPIMVNEGIAKRVKPMASKDVDALANYNKAMADLENKTPNSTYKSFLKNGDEDIRDEKDVQNYIDSLADSFKAIRQFAKNNKNSELTVMSSDSMYQAMQIRYEKSCDITLVSPGKYTANCPTVTALEVKLNRADFEALQMAASGYEIAVSLYNSYNLTGALDKALSLKGQKTIDSKAVIESLLQNKEFATLRAGNGMSRLKNMGNDAISGMRWVIQNQSTLCALGKNNSKNRIGMLFNEGLCAENKAETQKSLAQAEEVLSGKTYQASISIRGGSAYETTVKPSALLDSPIADLRTVAPISYDKCGNVTSIQDVTLSGLLVNGDANTILTQQSNCTK